MTFSDVILIWLAEIGYSSQKAGSYYCIADIYKGELWTTEMLSTPALDIYV